MDSTQRKILQTYNEICEEIEQMEVQMRNREKQALVISESNSAIFVPISLIETVMQENRSSLFLKSNYVSFVN